MVRTEAGFTLIELLIVIMIMGILLTVGIVTQSNLRDYATDRERSDDAVSIARRLEQAYTNQEVGGPSYPSTVELKNDLENRTRTLSGISLDALNAPGSNSAVSLIMATSNSQTSPLPDPTATTYVYQPLTADGSLCSSAPSVFPPTVSCVRFFLYYRSVINRTVLTIESLHQQ